jgi:prepilin-type N-terminal cleavage/methylation domain-containing protein
MTSYFCTKKGFTLVEAVVVSVIVAILSAVAIPMYVGYIRDQEQTTVTNLAETAAAAANAYFRRTGNDPPNLTVLNLYYDASKYTITINAGTNQITVTKGSYTSTKPY